MTPQVSEIIFHEISLINVNCSILEKTVIPMTIHLAINELFANVERKFGRTLVSHAVRYTKTFLSW